MVNEQGTVILRPGQLYSTSVTMRDVQRYLVARRLSQYSARIVSGVARVSFNLIKSMPSTFEIPEPG